MLDFFSQNHKIFFRPINSKMCFSEDKNQKSLSEAYKGLETKRGVARSSGFLENLK